MYKNCYSICLKVIMNVWDTVSILIIFKWLPSLKLFIYVGNNLEFYQIMTTATHYLPINFQRPVNFTYMFTLFVDVSSNCNIVSTTFWSADCRKYAIFINKKFFSPVFENNFRLRTLLKQVPLLCLTQYRPHLSNVL